MSESPRAYRDKNPYTPPPPEYQPASLIAEHWKLATLFAVVCIAFAVYCLKPPRSTRAAASAASSETLPSPAPGMSSPQPPVSSQPDAPIYIESIPQAQAQRQR